MSDVPELIHRLKDLSNNRNSESAVPTSINALNKAVRGMVSGNLPVEAVTLKGLPQTAGAPAGYGDLASAVSSSSSQAPTLVMDFSAQFPAVYTLVSGSPNVLEIAVCPYNGKRGLRIVSAAANASVQIRLDKLVSTEWNNQAYVMCYDNGKTYQQQMQMRVYSSASDFWGYQNVLSLTANGGDSTGGSVVRTYNDSHRAASGSPAAGSFTMTDCQLIFPTGTDWDMWIFGVGVGAYRKSRLCVVWDDGRESSLTLGYPTLAGYGIKKQTMALIKDRVNLDANAVTLSMCQQFINSGGAIVPHSPHNPNLVDQFPGKPDAAAAAVVDCINYISSLGLQTPNFNRCFVYPQGKYQAALFDTSYIEALRNVGIDIARISFMQNIRQQRNLDAHSRLGRLACTTIGHEYAGSSGAETTNINTVIQRINDCALYGVDCFLMLHSVTKLANSETNPYDITIPNLKLIGAAIKAQVDAGKMECVTMPELVINGDNYWNQF